MENIAEILHYTEEITLSINDDEKGNVITIAEISNTVLNAVPLMDVVRVVREENNINGLRIIGIIPLIIFFTVIVVMFR
jgi:hypothetical protein